MWEYKTITLHSAPMEDEELNNVFGKYGWELFSIIKHENATEYLHTYTFKRQKEKD